MRATWSTGTAMRPAAGKMDEADGASLVGWLASPEGSGVTGRDWLMNTVWNQT